MSIGNKAAGLIALLLVLCGALPGQPKPAGWPLGTRIPEISGQVADALTGKPVAGADVTLRASGRTGSFFGGGNLTLRYENSRTSPQGQFSFRSTLSEKVAGLLSGMEGYWLTVNLAFLTLEQLKKETPYSDPHSDSIGEDLSHSVTSAPSYRPRYPHNTSGSGERRFSSLGYFPTSVQFVHPCNQDWNANCVYFDKTRGLRIPLIPILDNPADCGKIADRTTGEQCRQLNTYWAAFRHTGTIAEFQADKELCGQVDQGAGTKTCMERLRGLDPALYEGRRSKEAETAQILVMTPVAGLTPMSPSEVWRKGEPMMHCVSYLRTDRDRGVYSSHANVWQIATEEERAIALRVVKKWAGDATERTEVVAGKSIWVFDTKDSYTAFWSSGTYVIALIFFKAAGNAETYGEQRASAAEATPAMRRELIRSYLAKHPPSR